jgi:hypothetical protein
MAAMCVHTARHHSAHGWACSARQSSEDCIYIMKVLRIKKKRESPPNREEPATRTVRRRRDDALAQCGCPPTPVW